MSGRTYSQSCFTLEGDSIALSEGEVAGSLNQYFATASADIPPLATSCLPSFLPSAEEVPIVQFYMLKRGGVPPVDLLKVYFAVISSVLEYCCPVWHNALPVKLSDSIERVQKRALCIIFPALHYQEALAAIGYKQTRLFLGLFV